MNEESDVADFMAVVMKSYMKYLLATCSSSFGDVSDVIIACVIFNAILCFKGANGEILRLLSVSLLYRAFQN